MHQRSSSEQDQNSPVKLLVVQNICFDENNFMSKFAKIRSQFIEVCFNSSIFF